MPITYPLTMPTSFGFSGFTYGLDNAVGVAESEFTFEQQTQEHQGTAWEVAGTLNMLTRDQAEEYNAFVAALNGRKGTFLMSIPGSETPRGAVTGSPLVNGAGQTGNTLNIDGLGLNVTNVFKAGDFIQLGTGLASRLFKVLENVNSNGSGQATLTLAPKIVTAFADNSAVVYSSPKGVFRMKSNMTMVDIKPPNVHSVSFSAREAK